MFPHTISIFNKKEINGEEQYFRVVVHSTLFVNDAASSLLKTGQIANNTVKVYIKKPVSTEAKEYVTSREFDVLSEVEAHHKYTIARGDYVAKGVVSLEDLTPQQYKSKYENMYEIEAVTDYDMGGLPNFFIVAR